jgi:F-type H+-transporting ATPase subunit b
MRRTRTNALTAALALVVLSATLVLGFASPAGASEETVGSCVKETIEEATDGSEEVSLEAVEAIEDEAYEECLEAPSPILPATNELIYGTLSFLILLGLLWKFAFPPLKTAMAARADRIREDLERAEGAKVEAEQTLGQYQSQLADARAEATRIIEEARKTADGLRGELQKRAEAEIAELKRRAAADVEAAKSQALADLKLEVANLAIGAAEVVVQHSLDRETQLQLVESYINQVGAQR